MSGRFRANRRTLGARGLRELASAASANMRRRRGASVPMPIKMAVVLQLISSRRRTQRSIAAELGVSQAFVASVNKKIREHTRRAATRPRFDPTTLRALLSEKKRGGGGGSAARRKLGTQRSHERVVRRLIAARSDLYLSELAAALEAECGVSVSESTLCRYLRKLGLTRKRKQRLVPREALGERNLERRREFTRACFGSSCRLELVGTARECVDQRNWRLDTAT